MRKKDEESVKIVIVRCHCDGDIHGDVYGLCTCENCKCREVKDEPEGLVVDETGECESCQ